MDLRDFKVEIRFCSEDDSKDADEYDLLTPQERQDRVVEIMAEGVIRLIRKKQEEETNTVQQRGGHT